MPKLEITFEGRHRVTVDCSDAAASFLELVAQNKLPVIAVQDYYDYYGLDKNDG